jgi:hypothetical protein
MILGTLITIGAAFLALITGYILIGLVNPHISLDSAFSILIFTFVVTASCTGFALGFRDRKDEVAALIRRILISLAVTALAAWLTYKAIFTVAPGMDAGLWFCIMVVSTLCVSASTLIVLSRQSAK